MAKIRNRHVRRETPKPMVLRERDLDVIEDVYRFRVLTQKQIQMLHFPSKETAQYRLERLYDNGFLERKFLPVVMGEGRSPTLYILDRLGAETLRTERGYDDIKWYSTSKDFSTEFLAHTIAINEVMVAVRLACRQSGFELEEWLTENEIKADYDRVTVKTATGRREQVAIVPDAVFSILAHNRRHRCLLELDRGTMEIDRFKNKIRAYIAYHESGTYEKRFHSSSMRVLTVIATRFTGKASGEKRLTSLKAATEAVGGRRRFWFTTAKSITPESILSEPIWYVSTDDQLQALLQSVRD